MKSGFLTTCIVFVGFLAGAQEQSMADSLALSLFRNKKVMYLDLGANSAPYSLNYRDSAGNTQSLVYRNNLRTILGFGFSYQWFSLRLATNLPFHFSSVNKHGETNYKDLVLEFKFKRQFFDLSLHTYKGYSIQDAYILDGSSNQEAYPNYIQEENRSLNLGLSHWGFINKNTDMSAIKGKRGIYLKKHSSFYIKSTVSFNGVSNKGPLIPEVKQNSLIIPSTSSLISSLDFGFMPGYLYANRYKNFHYSGMLGFGAVAQSKFYAVAHQLKNYPGLAPRFDLRLYAAYNVPKFFLIFSSEFENKSIRFTDFQYKQIYYMFRLTGGIRI